MLHAVDELACRLRQSGAQGIASTVSKGHKSATEENHLQKKIEKLEEMVQEMQKNTAQAATIPLPTPAPTKATIFELEPVNLNLGPDQSFALASSIMNVGWEDCMHFTPGLIDQPTLEIRPVVALPGGGGPGMHHMHGLSPAQAKLTRNLQSPKFSGAKAD